MTLLLYISESITIMMSNSVVLEILYRVGNFLALTPLYDFETNQLTYNFYYIIINTIVCIIFFVAPIPVFFNIEFGGTLNSSSQIIVKATMIVTLLTDGITTMTLIFNKSILQELFCNLKGAKDIQLFPYFEYFTLNMKQFYARINIIIIILMCSFINIRIVLLQNFNISVIVLFMMYANTVLAYILSLTWEICFIIHQHLTQISNCFRRHCSELNFTLGKPDGNALITDIRNIRRKIKFIYNSIEACNKGFGVWYTMLILSAILTTQLYMVLAVSELKNHLMDIDIILSIIISFSVCLVSILK